MGFGKLSDGLVVTLGIYLTSIAQKTYTRAYLTTLDEQSRLLLIPICCSELSYLSPCNSHIYKDDLARDTSQIQ